MLNYGNTSLRDTKYEEGDLEVKFIFGNSKTKPKDSEGESVMKNTFASKLKELRRERGMGQEQLASVCGVSVQAVSKWECEQSYPDIELLATIADTFGVTIDSLLRADTDVNTGAGNNEKAEAENVEDRLLAAVAEKFGVPKENIGRVDVHMSTGDETVSVGTGIVSGYADDLPDDGVLRVVQFQGRRMLDAAAYDPDVKIPLILGGVNGAGSELKIEVWGSTELSLSDNAGFMFSLAAGGDINVDGEPVNGSVAANGNVIVKGSSINGGVAASGDVNVREGCINGAVTAGGDIAVEEGIGGPVSAGGNVNCSEVGGSVSAGGSVDCGEIGGNVSAGGNIDCGEIGGSASAGGNIDCGEIGGDASAGGSIDCGEIGGDASAGGEINCGDVGGDVNADGDVSCGDVDGDVNAGGDVECGDVDGDVSAGGDVSCGDVGGDLTVEGNGEFGAFGGSKKKDTVKKKIDGLNVDLSNLGDYISRTVNDAMEAAFGKKKDEKNK